MGLVELYEKLGELLNVSDDLFIQQGPLLLQEAFKQGVFDGMPIARAEKTYTRRKLIGGNGKHVIRYMEWPPGCEVIPHEHHGRPCFEIVVSGQLEVTDFTASEKQDNHFELKKLNTHHQCTPGQAAVVDPRVTEIHSVKSGPRTRSIHVYPDDKNFCMGFVKNGDGTFVRKRFDLSDD